MKPSEDDLCDNGQESLIIQLGLLILKERRTQSAENNLNSHVLLGIQKHGDISLCYEKEDFLSLWKSCEMVYIEVWLYRDDQFNEEQAMQDHSGYLLIEQWKIEMKQNSCPDAGFHCTDKMLIQAIKSKLYFSQLSAWLSLTKGEFPRHAYFRFCTSKGRTPLQRFSKPSEFHQFPRVDITSSRSLVVSLHSLPRSDICRDYPMFSWVLSDPPAETPSRISTEREMMPSEAERSKDRSTKHAVRKLEFPEQNPSTEKSLSSPRDSGKTITKDRLVYNSSAYLKTSHPSSRQKRFRENLESWKSPRDENPGNVCLVENFNSRVHSDRDLKTDALEFNLRENSSANSEASCIHFTSHKDEKRESDGRFLFSKNVRNSGTVLGNNVTMERGNATNMSSSECQFKEYTGPAKVECDRPGLDFTKQGESGFDGNEDFKTDCNVQNISSDYKPGETISYLNSSRKSSQPFDADDCGSRRISSADKLPHLRNSQRRVQEDSSRKDDFSSFKKSECHSREKRTGSEPEDVQATKLEGKINKIWPFVKETEDLSKTKDFGEVLPGVGRVIEEEFKRKIKEKFRKRLSSRIEHCDHDQGTDDGYEKAGEKRRPEKNTVFRDEQSSVLRHGQWSSRHHFRHASTGTLPVFHPSTGLPMSSSPAPFRKTRAPSGTVDDIHSSPCDTFDLHNLSHALSKSAPALTTQSLLGNFEESVLNDRLLPDGVVEGFSAELSASGSKKCLPHVTLPVQAYFFKLSDDNAPSPYMGYISLDVPQLPRKGYHVPKKGTVQLTLFNPNHTVVKVFVVLYDFSDMQPNFQTFLRQRITSLVESDSMVDGNHDNLHYLIHLRFASSKSGRIYLHTDIRLIFARHPPDQAYLRTTTSGPTNPKYVPRPDNVN